jgi:hypothetical protein
MRSFGSPIPGNWRDVSSKPNSLQALDEVIVQVELPPSRLHRGSGLIAMMIIVPPFAAGDESYEPVIAALVIRLEVAIAEHMRQ